MGASSIKDDLRSFRRSWIHHTGMQLATLTILAGTFSILVFALSMSMNLKRVLASWGNGVHLTAYLSDDANEEAIQKIKSYFSNHAEIKSAEYVPREAATQNFKRQMASYAPGLLSDSDFANPFPASFRITLREGIVSDQDVKRLEDLATHVGQQEGIEDVSYGQSWIKTYSSFVTAITTAGSILAAVLLAGSLFVIGNSIRVSVSSRRDEIEILELVGATSTMIRRPYVVEGFMMGATAAAFALGVNYILHSWQVSVASTSVALARVVPDLSFLPFWQWTAITLMGALIGALGSWLTVRRLNDGWAARAGIDSQ